DIKGGRSTRAAGNVFRIHSTKLLAFVCAVDMTGGAGVFAANLAVKWLTNSASRHSRRASVQYGRYRSASAEVRSTSVSEPRTSTRGSRTTPPEAMASLRIPAHEEEALETRTCFPQGDRVPGETTPLG